MDDIARVGELVARLTDRAPLTSGLDGGIGREIDRGDGLGTEVQVTRLDVEAAEHGDVLRVGFVLDLPDEPRLRDVRRTGSVEVPFDAEWRRLSGFDTPASYAPRVAREVEHAARLLVEQHTGEPADDDGYELPDRATQWLWLLEALSSEGEVHQVGPGRIEITVEQTAGQGPRSAPRITATITPDQWELLLLHEIAPGTSSDYLGETLAPRDPDEAFLVYFEGRLEMSTREALPPVRGRAQERSFAELRARADAGGTQLGWVAEPPRGTA